MLRNSAPPQCNYERLREDITARIPRACPIHGINPCPVPRQKREERPNVKCKLEMIKDGIVTIPRACPIHGLTPCPTGMVIPTVKETVQTAYPATVTVKSARERVISELGMAAQSLARAGQIALEANAMTADVPAFRRVAEIGKEIGGLMQEVSKLRGL